MAVAQYYGTGRRKSSVARVRLVPGTGKITVNKKDVEEYIPHADLRLVINQPFQALLGGIELMHAGSDMVRDIVLCCLNVLVKLDFSRSVEQVQLRVECVVALALADTAGIVC